MFVPGQSFSLHFSSSLDSPLHLSLVEQLRDLDLLPCPQVTLQVDHRAQLSQAEIGVVSSLHCQRSLSIILILVLIIFQNCSAINKILLEQPFFLHSLVSLALPVQPPSFEHGRDLDILPSPQVTLHSPHVCHDPHSKIRK